MYSIGDVAEKLVLVLRDGRKLIGVLRSWDQFGTITGMRIACISAESVRSEYHSPGHNRAEFCVGLLFRHPERHVSCAG